MARLLYCKRCAKLSKFNSVKYQGEFCNVIFGKSKARHICDFCGCAIFENSDAAAITFGLGDFQSNCCEWVKDFLKEIEPQRSI